MSTEGEGEKKQKAHIFTISPPKKQIMDLTNFACSRKITFVHFYAHLLSQEVINPTLQQQACLCFNYPAGVERVWIRYFHLPPLNCHLEAPTCPSPCQNLKYFPAGLQLQGHMVDTLMSHSSCPTNSAEEQRPAVKTCLLFCGQRPLFYVLCTGEQFNGQGHQSAHTSEGLASAGANASSNEI